MITGSEPKGPGKPTRARAVEIHRYPVWPPKQSLKFFKAVREVGDELKEKHPNSFVSFVICGSRTKGLGKARRLVPGNEGRTGPSDVDIYAVTNGYHSELRRDINSLLSAKFVSLQKRAKNPVKIDLNYIYAPNLPHFDEHDASKIAVLFQLATHKEIQSVREDIVQRCLQFPELWNRVRGEYVAHNNLFLGSRYKFNLPALNEMPAWLAKGPNPLIPRKGSL